MVSSNNIEVPQRDQLSQPPVDRPSEALSLLAAIVNSSSDAIVSKTLGGVISTWNPGATALFGYSAEEMIGQSIRRLIPQDRQDGESIILRQLSSGTSVEQYETVRLHKSGEAIDVSVTISPIRDETGRIIGASKVVRDIRPSKRTENLLRKREAELIADALALERLNEVTSRLRHTDSLEQGLEEMLDASIALLGADTPKF
jgi:PAS domain S-box-containing protein